MCINIIVFNDISSSSKRRFICECLSSCVVFSFFLSFSLPISISLSSFYIVHSFIHSLILSYDAAQIFHGVRFFIPLLHCRYICLSVFLYLSHTHTSVSTSTTVNRVSDCNVFAFINVCNTSAFFRFWELYSHNHKHKHKHEHSHAKHVLHFQLCSCVCVCLYIVYKLLVRAVLLNFFSPAVEFFFHLACFM